MTEVVRSLIHILSTPCLRALILGHLGDLMSALLQVNYAGKLKKPMENSLPENNSETSKTFVMTEKWYERLLKDRNDFTVMYHKLVDNIYKPLVIKELLILLSPTKSIENDEVILPPPWLRNAVSKKLTEYLVSSGGVFLVMRAMCESTSDNINWKKVEILAKLISTVHDNYSEEKYYSTVGPQIISLLGTTGAYCIPVAKYCIKNIYQHNADIANKYIFDRLFEMFIICSKPVSENFSGTLVSEDSSSRCIEYLTKCFSPGVTESSVPMSILTRIIKIMYKLYMKISKSAYHHKSAIQDLLIEFLNSEKDLTKLKAIYDSLIFGEPHKDMLEMNRDLEFQFGPMGGIQVGKIQNEEISNSVSGLEIQLEFEAAGDYILDLLSSRSDVSRSLLTNLFTLLLSALTNFYDSKIDMPCDLNHDFLSVDELLVFLVKVAQKKIITVKLLAVLAENVQVMESIQEKPETVFNFVKNLLEVKAKDIVRENEMLAIKKDECDDEDPSKENVEDIFVALAVIDIMTVNVKTNSDRWDKCKSFLNPLEIIKTNCKDVQVQYLADILYNRICTHGAVSGSKKPQIRPFKDGKKMKMTNGKKNSKSTNVFVNGNEEKSNTKEEEEREKKDRKLIVEMDAPTEDECEFNKIYEDIRSVDVPTRGHAILELNKLIKNRNPHVLSKKEYIFSVLKCNLKHEDTYIYLSTINALETLGYVQKPGEIFEILCEEYTVYKKDSSEVQLKIGEVLMRLTRGLGEVGPKYKDLLINTFLFGTKSPDEILRASSLSNLGELLKIMGYCVSSVIQEVSC